MADPITFYLSPSRRVEIELINKHEFVRGDVQPDFSHEMLHYRIINHKELFDFIDDDSDDSDNSDEQEEHGHEQKEYRGVMSPISEVTVPQAVRSSVGIPKEARWFAFMHPPVGLAAKLNWSCYVDDDYDDNDDYDNNNNCNNNNKNKNNNNNNNNDKGEESGENFWGGEEGRDIFRDNVKKMNEKQQGIKNPKRVIRSEYSRTSLKSPNTHKKFQFDDEDDIILAHISVFGGFVYFNDVMETLSTNILTVKKTKYLFQVDGPYTTPKSVVEGAIAADRLQPIPLAIYHEAGIVAAAWIRPLEKFQSQCATEQRSTKYGSILFLRDNGDCFTYTFEKFWRGVDPAGDAFMMGDITALSKRALLKQDIIVPSFVDNHIITGMKYNKPSDTRSFNHQSVARAATARAVTKWTKYMHAKKMKKKVSSANWEKVQKLTLPLRTSVKMKNTFGMPSLPTSPREGPSNFLSNPIQRRTIVCEACQASASGDEMNMLLSECHDEANDILSQVDQIEWTPLHHACRFSARNESLIKVLVDRCPESLLKADKCGRLPIHLACDSDPSEAVIDILLGSEEGRSTVYAHTHHLQLLPLHVACHQKSTSLGIIRSLLEADCLGTTIREKTISGRLPLHNAIASKLEPQIIKYLLEVDSSLSMEVGPENDIYQDYQSLLPIHLAIQNQSSVETVSLLLQKDKLNQTFTSYFHKRKNCKFQKYYQCDPISVIFDTDQTKDVFCYRNLFILHLAIKSQSAEIVRLFLQKEKELQQHSPDNDRVKGVYCKDSRGRTPLHLACLNNLEPDIIFTLMELDPKRLTILEYDNDGYLPIHYLCRQKDAHPESLKFLLYAKKYMYWEKGANVSKRHCLLLSAMHANAPVEIIEMLMQPNVFSLNGVTGQTRTALANMVVSHKTLQKCIVREMADKTVFVLLFCRLYANIATSIFLFICSEQLIDGESTDPGGVTVLGVCTAIFILREIVQLLSEQLEDYFFDLWNWFEIINIGFLISSIFIFQNNLGKKCGENPEDCDLNEWVLITTAIIVLLSAVFCLRSTFLGFARFASGLTWIIVILVPFLITSFIVIMIFTYCYRIISVFNENGPESCNFSQPFKSCMVYTLGDFITGNDDAESSLDLIFGLIAVVILLNVVIAIVSEVWEKAAKTATILFWDSRIGILAETDYFRRRQSDIDFIEKQNFIPLRTEVSWKNDYPFNKVKSFDEYKNPENYFEPKVAERIRSGHSLAATFHWIRVDSETDKKRHKSLMLWKASVTWLAITVLYVIIIIIGFCSIGLFLPRHAREKVLSFGQNEVGHKQIGASEVIMNKSDEASLKE